MITDKEWCRDAEQLMLDAWENWCRATDRDSKEVWASRYHALKSLREEPAWKAIEPDALTRAIHEHTELVDEDGQPYK